MLTMPDAQLLGIAVAAMVAGVLLFRLYTVLGRRTGHEPGQPAPKPVTGALPPPDKRAGATPPEQESGSAPAAPPLGHGLLDIELADRSFDGDHFLKGARTAYEIILKAFAGGDRLALRPLLSDDVYAAFEQDIAARGTRQAEALTGITDARIVGAALTGNAAEVTVAFRGQFTGGEGRHDVTDVWTFARTIGASDPNWTLVATSGTLP